MSYNTVGIIKNGVKQKLPVVMVAPKVDGPDYVEVTADGVKTNSQLLDELFSLTDLTKITKDSVLVRNDKFLRITYFDGVYAGFTESEVAATADWTLTQSVYLRSSGSEIYVHFANGSHQSQSSTVTASGKKITLYYDTATLDLTTRASNSVYDNSNSGLSATDTQGAIDELAKPPVETLTFADVITMATGITAQTGSYAKKVGNKIYVHILGSGSLTFGPNGSIQIATISSDYRPRVRQAGNTLINPATTGQNYGSCGVGIYESGNLALAYGTGSATIGNASYPWTTSSGIDVCWEL